MLLCFLFSSSRNSVIFEFLPPSGHEAKVGHVLGIGHEAEVGLVLEDEVRHVFGAEYEVWEGLLPQLLVSMQTSKKA